MISQLIKLTRHPLSSYILVGIVCLMVIIANLIWIHIETRPPHWDMARHLWTSLLYQNQLEQHSLLPFLQNYHYYPPLLYWLANLFYIPFGTSVASAVAANSVFIIILGFSVFEIGKLLWGRLVGLVAVVSVLAYPIMTTQFKEFQLDAPLAAMTALTLLMLMKSREFSQLGYSLGFGAAAGLGMLTKWTFAYIIAAPLLLALGIAVTQSWRQRSWLRLRHIGLATGVAYIIASIWYTGNLQQLWIDLRANGGAQQAALEGDPALGTFASATWYLQNFVNQQVFLIPALILLGSLVALLFYRSALMRNRYLIATLLGGYLVFTFLISNKDARYTIPLLPAVALLSWWWLTKLQPRFKLVVAAVATTASIFAFLTISFGNPLWQQPLRLGSATSSLTILDQRGYIIGPPTRQDWHIERAFRLASQEVADKRSLFYQGPDTIWLNKWDLTYYGQTYQVSVTPSIEEASLVVIRSQDPTPSPPTGRSLIERSTLPDNTILSVYR